MTILIYILGMVCLLSAVVMLSRYLPAQNVVFIILFLAGIEVAFEMWNDGGNWAQGALFWPGAIILLRGGVQIIMEPWRRTRNYGLVVVGMVSGATLVIQALTGELTTAALRFCVTGASLFFLTPWLIQKRVRASEVTKK